MNGLSPGKIRALQSCSTRNGIFTILAIDHRDSMRVLLDPADPTRVPAAQLSELKLDIIQHIAPQATAVMLEPEYSAAQAIVAGVLPGQVGFLCALEAQGYLGDPYARQTTLLNGWGVAKAKRLGASGVKLLLFYHPDAGEVTERQEQTVRAVIAESDRYEIPLFLEPLAYSLDPATSLNSAEFARQRRYIVVESARRLSALGPDVLKVQFPIEVNYEADQAVWREACAELNDASAVPWALLSGGDPYETFKAQLQVACQAGCSGFMVGRALWREVISTTGSTRAAVLRDVVLPRFTELSQLATASGQGWQKKQADLPEIDENWFRQY